MTTVNPRAKRKAAAGGIMGRIENHLGLRGIHSERDLASLVEKRLPVEALRNLAQHGLKDDEIYELVIPRRTLSHRIARQQRLTLDESDRVVRIARTFALAGEVFGSEAASLDWLRSPKRRFEYRPPISMLSTEAGARLVEELLFQIDHGMPG